MDILLASLLSPITLSFVAGMFATLIGFEIKVPKRALQLFAALLLFAIGIDGGRGLAASDLRDLGAGLAVTFSLILLLPALSYVIARYLIRFSVADSAALATLYGSVSSAVLMAAYAESGDMNLEVDGLVMGMAALMQLGVLVALLIGTLALRRETGTTSSNRPGIADIGGGAFLLLLFGLLIGWLIGDRRFGRIETIVDLILRDAKGQVRQQLVHDILTRVVYAGCVEARGWGVTLRKGHHGPLISMQTYNRVQKRREAWTIEWQR